MKRAILALILPLGLLAAWQYAAAAGFLSPAYFPAPLLTFEALRDSIITGSLWGPFAATAVRMFEGWFVASLLGILLGALVGSSRTAREFLQPTLEFLRPFPASAVIPAAILIFGLSNSMAIWVIAFGSVWPVLLSTLHGFSTIEPRLKEVSLALEIPPSAYLRKIALPSALPDMFTGVRISLAIALILAVVVEMQSAQPGLGQNILLAQRMFRSPELYAGIVVLGLFGFVASWILDRAERRLLVWKSQRWAIRRSKIRRRNDMAQTNEKSDRNENLKRMLAPRSTAFAVAWSTLLSFSGGRRLSGAYFSGPDFSAMVYPYTGASVAR
jgi:sulfonate transport system permease protein